MERVQTLLNPIKPDLNTDLNVVKPSVAMQTMMSFISTKQLAQLAGITERGVTKAINSAVDGRCQWRGAVLDIKTIEGGNTGRGGKSYLISVDSLPPELKEKYKALNPVKTDLNTVLNVEEVAEKKEIQTHPPTAFEKSGRVFRDQHWRRWQEAKQVHRDIAIARFDTLVRIEQRISKGMTKTAAIRSDIFETRETIQPLLKVMDEKEATLRTGRILVSESTIYEWYRMVEGLGRHDWQPALLPEFKGRTTQYTIQIGDSTVGTCLNYDPEILQAFADYYLDRRKRTYTYAYKLTKDWVTAKGLGEMPSIATLKRHLDATFPKQVQDFRREGKEASSYKNAASLSQSAAHETTKGNCIMKAEELDQLSTLLKRPARQPKKISISFPEWVIHSLNREAEKIGVTRQTIIKTWIAERLQQNQTQGKP